MSLTLEKTRITGSDVDMIRFEEEPHEYDRHGDYMARWNEAKPGPISSAASYVLTRCVRLGRRVMRWLEELWAAR